MKKRSSKNKETQTIPAQNELAILHSEIDKLENDLEEIEDEIDWLHDEGIESVIPVMILNAPYPLGLHVLMKAICFFWMTGPDFIIPNLPIVLHASDALALYFSVPMTLLILTLALISKKGHTNYLKKKTKLESEAESLQKELVEKKSLYKKLERRKAQEDDSQIAPQGDSSISKLKELITLHNFRRQLILHYENGTLEEYLKSLGYTSEEIEAQKDDLIKSLNFKKEESNK